MSTENTCKACGAVTRGLVFCSSACAAGHDKRSSPQRRPGGACAECGAAILKRKRHCDTCAPVVAEREQKAKAGYMTVRTSAGLVEVRAPRVPVRRETVFSRPPRRPFGADACCGEVLDVLIGLARARPPYVADQDARRYVALLCDLRAHVATIWDPTTMTEHTTPVGEMPVVQIERCLRSWCEYWLHGEHHPLMSSFALDAVEFILCHVYGTHELARDEERSSWRIPALLPESVRDLPATYHSIRGDSRFKGEVTQRIGGMAIKGMVPRGGRIIIADSREVVVPAEREFGCTIVRCHLSQSLYDWTDMEAVDDAEPAMSLSREFRIPCEVQVPSDRADHFYRCRVKVPARWITHVLRVRGRDESLESLPIPEWLTGSDA